MSSSTTESLRIIRPAEVCAMLGIHRCTLWAWERRGVFPPRVAVGPRFVGWTSDTVESWIRDRPTVVEQSA